MGHVRQLVGCDDAIDDRGSVDRKGLGDRTAQLVAFFDRGCPSLVDTGGRIDEMDAPPLASHRSESRLVPSSIDLIREQDCTINQVLPTEVAR